MLNLSLKQARRFLLQHHFLYPPRQLSGTEGVMQIVERFGCIQFDPVEPSFGRNAELVLQSRVADYRPQLLEKLLYQERQLWDGYDKVMSIYLAADWPFFARWRALMQKNHGGPDRPPMKLAEMVLAEIQARGPLSSIDFDHDGQADWFWGQTRLVRATLESLFMIGRLGIHHRVNTRRVFDLTEHLLPEATLNSADPLASDEDYQDWHMLRRIGGLGLAQPGSGEQWLDMVGMKSPQRIASLNRLIAADQVTAVQIAEIPGRILYARAADLASWNDQILPESQAAFLAPLDNLLWDRKLVRWVFDFDYIWEVYKPAHLRRYGYYVLPVLYGDHFVARFEPKYDRQSRRLTIQNWWWEEGASPDAAMQEALDRAVQDFGTYLNATEIVVGPSAVNAGLAI
ncbi:MAG TPA: crosslink repair DNA glycosylase YcaQ family protein [Anaerolineaceae bacterium]|nr:crosslink repair DNA glycosylase YcaQ family protein [Anaerolineaceae bacterium]